VSSVPLPQVSSEIEDELTEVENAMEGEDVQDEADVEMQDLDLAAPAAFSPPDSTPVDPPEPAASAEPAAAEPPEPTSVVPVDTPACVAPDESVLVASSQQEIQVCEGVTAAAHPAEVASAAIAEIPAQEAAGGGESHVSAASSSSAAPGSADPPAKHVPHMSPKEFFTPAMLQRLAPPQCTFALDQRAHRFSFKFRKAPSPNVWEDQFKYPMSMSKAFVNMPWRDALKEVHSGAWERWNLVKEQDGFKISDHSKVKSPGCVSEDILSALEDFIASMPPPVKYGKYA